MSAKPQSRRAGQTVDQKSRIIGSRDGRWIATQIGKNNVRIAGLGHSQCSGGHSQQRHKSGRASVSRFRFGNQADRSGGFHLSTAFLLTSLTLGLLLRASYSWNRLVCQDKKLSPLQNLCSVRNSTNGCGQAGHILLSITSIVGAVAMLCCAARSTSKDAHYPPGC